jgi:hypothetical protein
MGTPFFVSGLRRFRSASLQASLRGSSLPLVKASIASTICP